MNSNNRKIQITSTTPLIASPHHIVVYNSSLIPLDHGTRVRFLPGKDRYISRTNENIFTLLQSEGIPTYFRGSYCPVSFKARLCEPIPITCVVRRLATGLYVERHAEIMHAVRFEKCAVELYFQGGTLKDPLMIWNKNKNTWFLHACDQPLTKSSRCGEQSICIDGKDIDKSFASHINAIARRIFLILEKKWATFGKTLVDISLTFGFDAETGELLLTGTLDSDAWQLWEGLDRVQQSNTQVYKDATSPTSQELDRVLAWYRKMAGYTTSFVPNLNTVMDT